MMNKIAAAYWIRKGMGVSNMQNQSQPYQVKASLRVHDHSYVYYSLPQLEELGAGQVSHLPFTIKILLEAAIRQYDGRTITKNHIDMLLYWYEKRGLKQEIPFKPSRILLQDFTSIPCLQSLAAMRSLVKKAGKNPKIINPLIPVDIVVDHSLIVDEYGSVEAMKQNIRNEFSRNEERYRFLRWAQNAFDNLRIIPPGNGIVHQINLEYLASLITEGTTVDYEPILFPDSVIGADSHTPMINGLGILGWGVGGIEAEAGMLGQPLFFTMPEVVGVKLTGKLPDGVSATDLALTITQVLRQKGVVGAFVEFYGDGLSQISLADRATIANMAPEYGATVGYFPVDAETLNYLRMTGRSVRLVQLAEQYYRAQGMFRIDGMPDPVFSETVTIDMSAIVPSIAGPKRPQDRVEVTKVKESFQQVLTAPAERGGYGLSLRELEKQIPVEHPNGQRSVLRTGDIVIAAITSCTNTSNPSVMLAAGLVAKKAAEKGLKVPAYVKSTLTPGSKVVGQYLADANLLKPLESLGFHVAGYGCATCIGNSGPLSEEVTRAITENQLTVSAILSGNRNFEGRIHPHAAANYLASPPLVIAYALAGTMNIDLSGDPLGHDRNGHPVYLRDIWPSRSELNEALKQVRAELFEAQYANVSMSNELWNQVEAPKGELYEWDANSTYIQEPPFFEGLKMGWKDIMEIREAKTLVLLGNTVTTDHISPGGSIKPDSPAGIYLKEKGLLPSDFNSYGARRGAYEVAVRATFANQHVQNFLVPDRKGGLTKYLPTNEILPIYDAAMRYAKDKKPLIIIAGKEYGTGSSRDWAAKGPYLLGIKAVIAESFERIHRNNLVGMGILPLQFLEGESWRSLDISGEEDFDILGLHNHIQPGQILSVQVTRPDGNVREFNTILRLDSEVEVDYYRNEGILQTVLRNLMKKI